MRFIGHLVDLTINLVIICVRDNIYKHKVIINIYIELN